MQRNRIPEAPHALTGVRGLLRVLKFDSGSAAEGCGGRLILLKSPSYKKNFTTALRASENRPTALAGEEEKPPEVAHHRNAYQTI